MGMLLRLTTGSNSLPPAAPFSDHASAASDPSQSFRLQAAFDSKILKTPLNAILAALSPQASKQRNLEEYTSLYCIFIVCSNCLCSYFPAIIMPLAALTNELLCMIADSLRTEDLCSTIEACKSFRAALLAKHWRHAAAWAASRRFLLETAQRTRERKAEIRHSLSTLIHCSSYLGSREAIECAVLFHLIAEATGYQDLAEEIKKNSPLSDFQLTPPTTISTEYKAPLQPSCEAVVVGYLYAAAKFGVIRYLQQVQTDPFCDKKHSIALADALSIAVTHNDIFAAKQLIEHGASSGGSVRCVELQVGERKYRPPRGFINQLCIAVLHEHEEMVRFISEDMCQDDCLSELWGGLEVARKYKLDKLEKFLGEVYNWHLVNSPGVKYNLEREGLTIDIPRPW